MRLVRPPGLHRVGTATGRQWQDDDGVPLTDRAVLDRLQALAVPPAWEQVWASADPQAAVQATGVDARGRTQYRYLPAVVRQRSDSKFGHLGLFGAALPALRAAVARDLDDGMAGGPPERRAVLAAMVRLLELGFFRVGSARYAREDHTYGLSTLRRDQVTVTGASMHFDYVAKEHLHRVTDVVDAGSARVVRRLLDAAGADDEALFRECGDAGPRAVSSSAVNAYVHALVGVPASAKEFRTWSGTVVAAAALGGAELPGVATRTGTAPAVRAVRSAAALLGNTPAVARASYVHPGLLAAGPDPGVVSAVAAFDRQHGHRDLRAVWTDAVVQAAVTEQLLRVPPTD